jgi:hypothetical protein
MGRVVMAPGWRQNLNRHVSDFMKDLAKDVLDDMQRYCPIDTGTLRADLDYEVHGGYARIGARSVPHAIFAEEGVGPHVIRPNSMEALHWTGARHPVESVNHPGYPGSHFMKRALYQKRAGRT